MKSFPRALFVAMFAAAAVTAQFVGGKALRDALFLTSLDLSALPAMLIATSICSIALVTANGKAGRRIAPATLVPASFVASGVLFLVEWLLRSWSPSAVAAIVYLHISGAGPLLTSGFWLIASERFDPRTAKRRFGQIAAAGTVGGLLSALVAERVAAMFGVPAMLPLLAGVQFGSAWLVRAVAASSTTRTALRVLDEPASVTPPAPSGLRVLGQAPYLRNLAALVLLGTTGAALVDYLFKAQAVATFGRGDNLLRFFALYYAATSVVTFALQTSMSRVVLERFGLAASTSTPSGALLAGSVAGLVAPGFGTMLFARGGESVLRSSFYRAGYELFYTAIPAREKRAAKTLIDVGFDRLGDGFGGGLVRLAALLAPAVQSPVILLIAMVCSTGAILAASRLDRGYIRTLGSSLVDLSNRSATPATIVTSTLSETQAFGRFSREASDASATTPRAPAGMAAARFGSLDPEVRDVLDLRSRDRARVVQVLAREDGLTAGLVSHAITLLAWEPVANHAIFALRKVAEEHVGQLVDALLDPGQDFAVRRCLARVFSVCVSQRAASGLLFGLQDSRFDVRYQSARSLAAIVDKNPRVKVDAEEIFAAVLREVAVSRPVWESRRLLDGFDEEDSHSPVDEFVRMRAGESLGHVFTLLSLVLPRQPLQIAFRSLQTDDDYLRGTALEYLEGVQPPAIRERLWPFLEQRPVHRPPRPRDEVIAELLRSNHSIMLNLQELRLRAGLVPADSAVS